MYRARAHVYNNGARRKTAMSAALALCFAQPQTFSLSHLLFRLPGAVYPLSLNFIDLSDITL